MNTITNSMGSLVLTLSLAISTFSTVSVLADINKCGGFYGKGSVSATPVAKPRSLEQSIRALDAARSESKGQISFSDLLKLKPDLINYYKSFGPGKRIVVFTGAPSLDKSFDPRSITNLRRPIKKQTSGIVTVQEIMASEIKRLTGLEVRFVTPEEFGIHYQMKYQEVILSAPRKSELKAIIEDERNVGFHIMVEDSVGQAAKGYMEKRGIPYTTAYHTDFPLYARGFAEYYLPNAINKMMWTEKGSQRVAGGIYKFLNGFHGKSEGIMVPTITMAEKLIENGFPREKIRFWSHGVDIDLFHPSYRDPGLYERELGIKMDGRPVALFVGRIGEEKNIRDFLDAKLVSEVVDAQGNRSQKEAVKVVIGSGPELEILTAEYPNVHFLGRKAHDTELPKYMASADGFVFTSLTETFGLVGPEALSSGTPTLTYKVQGMQDWNTDPKAGIMVPHTKERSQNLANLSEGWKNMMKLKKSDAREFAETMPWERSILEFLFFLNPSVKP